MPSPEGFRVGLGTEYIGNTRISIVPKPEQPRTFSPPASDTARHEAKHAVVAEANGTLVKRVTIVPGPGYGGLTELSRPDPIAAMASHGENGTGHDRLITRLMGYDEGAMARAAKDILNKKEEHVKAVANALDANRTIDGNKVRRIISKIDEDKNRQPKRKADVFITDTNGGHKEIKDVPMIGGIVIFNREWVPISGKKSAAS